MDYEDITDQFIQNAMKKFELKEIYQEFMDSIIDFNGFSNTSNEEFMKYLKELED